MYHLSPCVLDAPAVRWWWLAACAALAAGAQPAARNRPAPAPTRNASYSIDVELDPRATR